MRAGLCLLAIIATLSSANVMATQPAGGQAEAVRQGDDTGNCWQQAALRYGVSPWLLYAIAERESQFDPNAINTANSDGTRDLGLMQINTFWLPHLRKFNISEQDLFDPCTNIHVGAWILAQNIQQFGNNWIAVGAYNVGTRRTEPADAARRRYGEDIRSRFNRHVGRLSLTTRETIAANP